MNRLSRLAAASLAVFLFNAQGQTPSAAGSAKPPAAEPPASSALDSDLFYQLLLGEINVRGGEPGTGYALVLDAARKTNDAGLYQRAVEIALQARAGGDALVAARAWKAAQPTSREANRYVLQILIAINRVAETLEPLRSEVSLAPVPDRNATIAVIPRNFSRVSDKKLAASIVEQALGEFLTAPGTASVAWTAVGRLRLAAADTQGALEAAQRAQAADAAAEGPVLLALELMDPKLPQAEALIRKYMDGKALPEVRMVYARALMDNLRFAEAGQQLQIITTDKPDYAEAWLAQGTLELQENRINAAETALKRFIELANTQRKGEERNRGLAQAYLSLSQIAEKRRDFAMAEAWLNRIENSEDLVSAQNRRASILAGQGRMDEARKLIRSLPERNAADARMKLSAEVQLLRDNKQYKAAYDLLAGAMDRFHDDADLRYDLATLAEKIGSLGEMERLLRQIMADKPDYHHAYNALGYSLAERNVRLPEAKQLVQKALEYAPGDPYITDSLGWVEFRMGNKAEAARILEGAYKAKPDAEIAAHLGEVLWTMGQRDRAQSIWKEGLLINSENETLLETLKRFRVKP